MTTTNVPTIDFTKKGGDKEDVTDERKGIFGLTYEVPMLLQVTQAAKAPQENPEDDVKQLFEVTLVGYLDNNMVAALYSKADGFLVKIKF